LFFLIVRIVAAKAPFGADFAYSGRADDDVRDVKNRCSHQLV